MHVLDSPFLAGLCQERALVTGFEAQSMVGFATTAPFHVRSVSN